MQKRIHWGGADRIMQLYEEDRINAEMDVDDLIRCARAYIRAMEAGVLRKPGEAR
jgi:hypothetical protein